LADDNFPTIKKKVAAVLLASYKDISQILKEGIEGGE
jgi:hypothetical protein